MCGKWAASAPRLPTIFNLIKISIRPEGGGLDDGGTTKIRGRGDAKMAGRFAHRVDMHVCGTCEGKILGEKVYVPHSYPIGDV